MNKNVGQIVADDYRTAAVFSQHGIDFCCKGHRSLEEASSSKKVPLETLIAELQTAIDSPADGATDFQSWPPDLLADYIERIHHSYVTEKMPLISQYLHKLCRVHGSQHQELLAINTLFLESTSELAAHMKKEEQVLFPYIRKMVGAQVHGVALTPPVFGSVQRPVHSMMHEHDAEGERFREIARLSNHYNPPADACTTYRVTYGLLREFENNLHQHVHLENNILFPKAIALEEQMMSHENPTN